MGSTYDNVIVLSSTVAEIATLVNQPAYLTQVGPHVVVFGDAEMDPDALALPLSATGRTCIWSIVFDSDLMNMSVYRNGIEVASVSAPENIGAAFGDEEFLETGTDPAAFCAALEQPERTTSVAAMIAADFVFADEVHETVLAQLGLPTEAAGNCFRWIERGEWEGGPLVRVN